MPFASSLSRKQTGCHFLWVVHSSLISSMGWQLNLVDRLWHRRIPADFRLSIAFWVWWKLSLEASVYIFLFSFSEVSPVKYHSQSHWLNWKRMSSATNLPPPYLFLAFQFPAQEKSGSFPYKKDALNALNLAGFNWSTQNGWLTTPIRSRA